MTRLAILLLAGLVAYKLVVAWAWRVQADPFAEPFAEPFGDC